MYARDAASVDRTSECPPRAAILKMVCRIVRSVRVQKWHAIAYRVTCSQLMMLLIRRHSSGRLPAWSCTHSVSGQHTAECGKATSTAEVRTAVIAASCGPDAGALSECSNCGEQHIRFPVYHVRCETFDAPIHKMVLLPRRIEHSLVDEGCPSPMLMPSGCRRWQWKAGPEELTPHLSRRSLELHSNASIYALEHS